MTLLIAIIILSLTTSAHAKDFTDVTYHTCYDGNTCRITIPSLPEVRGQHALIEVAGINTPELKGKCEREKHLAIQARDRISGILEKAHRIDLIDPKLAANYRIVANVIADGQDMSEILLREGLADTKRRGKRKKNWCE